MGYVDFLISDPDYKGRDRFEIITQLIERCSEYGVERGCRIVWAMTTYKGVVSRCEKLGHTILEEDYTVIYTHDKAYEKLTKRNKEIEWKKYNNHHPSPREEKEEAVVVVVAVAAVAVH